ncbi:CDT1-like protein a, chloroplastic isoform X2 [Rhododendron vialii]|uniref:CDT1-like protein a, chloroplastic isoform X2 n=1 Tax=Rhododendron vialii TaxID=182163 RepID=UPI00265D89F0|nr:CDT1-like protein a, chloroplastic isoform X2 [Rhododendron vialii]
MELESSPDSSKKTLQSSSSQNPSTLDEIKTPEKLIGKPKKKVDGSVKLPQKYEILGKFFDSLDSSIRLLRLKGCTSTFTNISPKVECLTDRRFSYAHLAQLKFILPEVIVVKKVLVHDERTSCMKPDLHIALNVDAVKDEGELKSTSGNSNMRKIFHSRLLDFCKAHPEGEVPEENLPEPFNKSKLDMHTSTSNASISSWIGETSTGVLPEQQPAAATHLSHTFRKHFSQKVSSYATTNSDQEKDAVCLQPSALFVSKLDVDQSSNGERISAYSSPSIGKLSLKPLTSNTCSSLGASQASVTPSHPHTTPLKEREMENETSSSVGTATIQGTPAKLVSTPVKLMSATPALRTPKRSYMSPDDYSKASQNKLIRRPLCNRSLEFDSPVKNAEVKDEVNLVGGLSVDNNILDILPEKLLESIKEKERKAVEVKDPAISQAKRRQKMIASLPKLFDVIRFLFQSIKRSVITKEEFMHRIVANHLDIVDRRDVEEQLKLLQELTPEWIYEKLASSGDLLICINKKFSPDSMRARLVEAK